MNRGGRCIGFFTLVLLTVRQKLLAQAAGEGLTGATTEVTKYFGLGVTLMYSIGAVVGIVGAIKVYNKWNAGDQDTSKVAASWFGSCIFLVVVATVLRGFFGVS
ncbi:DUF4134 domain-containing protein [Niastella sp. OAS944]|uniref:DUF4134 domain-containing protein n=1 Tax=Niastella sp. OAS944 TaxID=2664089 RepID=UPI0035C87401|nr:hypothetical protein [Chitinophagaceae bacterium OAS944]